MTHDNENIEETDLEELDTQSMIEESFFSNLAHGTPATPSDVQDEVVSAAAYQKARKIGEIGKGSSHREEPTQLRTASIVEVPENVSTENLLMDLFDARDSLIDRFGEIDMNSDLGSSITATINKLGSCINRLGGGVDNFDPIDHVSGLGSPDLTKAAEEVVKRTRQCYTLGEITVAEVSKDGGNIRIGFKGVEKDLEYEAIGEISAKDGWIGNEAIDYIYTPGAGKMSVKSFDGRTWVDKTKEAKSSYDVQWELAEWGAGEDPLAEDADMSVQEDTDKKAGVEIDNPEDRNNEQLNKSSAEAGKSEIDAESNDGGDDFEIVDAEKE